MVGVSLICREIVLLQLRAGGDKSHLHFILRRGLFFGPSLRDIVGRGLHSHFKSIFIPPLSERTSPVKGGYGGEKIGGKVAWTIFFLFIYCAGDAQYRWGEDILVCACRLCFLLFVVVFYGDLVGSIDFFLNFVYCNSYRVSCLFSPASFIYVIPAPLRLHVHQYTSAFIFWFFILQTWVEISHIISIESYLLPSV